MTPDEVRSSNPVVGLDVGGTLIKAGLFTGSGESCLAQERATPNTAPYAAAVEELGRAVKALLEAAGVGPQDVAGMCVGVPGAVDPASGRCVLAPNLIGWRDVPVRDDLRRQTGIERVEIANDTFCATVAELRRGAGRDVENLVLFALGTGVGGGVAFDNKVRRGPRQVLGEVGHMIIDRNGPRCGCGNHGCLEAFVGKQAIINRAARALQTGRSSLIADRTEYDLTKITPKIIAEAAKDGDEVALEVLRETGEYIALAICTAIVLADPDIVILGGGIANAGEPLFGPIRRAVQARMRMQQFDPRRIVPAALGDKAGMIGAGAHAAETFLNVSW